MKKAINLLLVFVLLMTLTACGKAGKVEKMIDAIGTVSIESIDAIQAAQDAYDALESEDQAKVKNFDVLVEAHEQYAIAVKEKEYSEAVAAFDAKDYLTAAAMFKSLGDFSDAGQKLFETSVALFNEGKYTEAADIMNSCDNGQKDVYLEYMQGLTALESNDYETAQKHFEAAGNLSDSADKITVCMYMQAEANMEKGYLNTAKDIYSKLPGEFSYNGGKTVADRLASLEKHASFVELCGVWRSKDMDGSVRQTHTSTGLWDQWDGDGWNYDVTITCVINDDDTVTMKAKAGFWHYTNYSSLSKYLKTTDDSCTFTYTGTKVPTKMDYSLNFKYEYSGTLTIKNKTFKLDYKIVDRNSSMNFNYTYKSFGTYDTFVKAL